MTNTLYVWDLADTLFFQKWNEELMGAATPLLWMKKQRMDVSTLEQYERNFEKFFLNGTTVDLALMPGYAEVLAQTNDNQAFTTGVIEQVDWRAEYLNPQVGFDIKKFFTKIVSTFDFVPTNLKTSAVIDAYLEQEAESYEHLVYTDNDLTNCELFHQIGRKYFASVRVFHFKNDGLGLRPQNWCAEVGCLTDILTALKK